LIHFYKRDHGMKHIYLNKKCQMSGSLIMFLLMPTT